MRFNPPPNWPVAADWVPEPGWTPDPSWPAAPAGWQFWIDDSPPAPTPPQAGPQWQSPVPVPPPAGPPNHTTRNVLIAVGVGAVLIIALVVVLVVGFGGSDSKSTDSATSTRATTSTSKTGSTSAKPKSDEDRIRATLSSVEAAWNANDYEMLADHLCGASSESGFTTERQKAGEMTFHIKSIKVTGATAKVVVQETFTKTDAYNGTLDLKKEAGEWKLCL